jgi:hypothetical protein
MHGIEAQARLVMALVAVCIGVACSTPIWLDEDEPLAPGFNEIPEEQLRSTMGRLAAGVREIEAILATESPNRERQQPELLRVLDEMIATADELGPEGGVAGEHWFIPHSLGRFREKLAIARDSVAANPPRYYLVGNLSGTCLSCHRIE